MAYFSPISWVSRAYPRPKTNCPIPLISLSAQISKTLDFCGALELELDANPQEQHDEV